MFRSRNGKRPFRTMNVFCCILRQAEMRATFIWWMVSYKRFLSIHAGLSCWKMCRSATDWQQFGLLSFAIPCWVHEFLSPIGYYETSPTGAEELAGSVHFLLWMNPSALLPSTVIQRKLCPTTHLHCSISRPCWGWDNHMPYLTSSFLLPSHCYSRVCNWKAVERGLFESWCLPLGNQDIDFLITYVHPFPKAYTASPFLWLQVSLREQYILTSNP